MSLKFEKMELSATQDWVEPLDWFFSPLPCPFPYPSLAIDSQEVSSHFHRALYPFSADYYHKLIPLFSCSLTSEQQLEGRDSLFLRDGAIGLLHFLNTQQELIQKSSCRFFVHHKLKSIIPTNLRQAFSYYDYYSSPPKNVKPERLLIGGTFFNGQLDESFVKKQVSLILKTVTSTSIQGIDLLLTSGTSDSLPKEVIAVIKYLEKEFKVDSQICHWKDLAQQRFIPEALNKHFYFELNPQFFYSDSFVFHYALKKGASLLYQTKHKTQEDFRLPLSPYHGLRLWEEGEDSQYIIHDNDQKILNMLLQEKNQQTTYVTLAPPTFPWNNSFSEFVQAMIQKENWLSSIT